MTGTLQLSRPILGEVDKDGRLLRADDALEKLNQRAGGIEGTTIAIPALYRLAELARRLQMRLARAVRVSDETENLELWVEVEPSGDITRLSIQSWRILGGRLASSYAPTDVAPEHSGEYAELHFDIIGRLIRASGLPITQLVPEDFGNTAEAIVERLIQPTGATRLFADSIRSMKAFAPTVIQFHTGESMLLSGQPAYDATGDFIEYRCRLEHAVEVKAPAMRSQESANAGALFGKHLAPVLRQPLGRIIANAETIGSELQGPIRENYAAYARDIANAARHLSALVDDLGDLEAVEREDFSTAPDKIELGDVARRVAGLLALKAADHSIRLITPRIDLIIGATAEFRRVLQILLNLVTNAIRYSPDGTDVQIDIHASGEWAYVTVADQGKGIADDDRERVFEKFERLGRSGDGGSGLGLYISRRLARAMGGDLTVGQADSGGAIFTLRLPKD